MEILAAYDLTESYRDAGKLAGCDHHTVARYVAAREAGQLTAAPARRTQIADPYRELVEERKSWLFCAWLSWSRYRVVLPIRDKTVPTLLGCLDTTLRAFGGVPTYGLTDNEKTVTVEHVARIAVRNPQMLDFARHYGLRIATCMPADPASKGGSESTVKLAKADLVPTEANLLGEYESFAELEKACAGFCEQVNAREHRVTRRAPAEMLTEERTRLHPLPEHPYTAAFGVTRIVGDTTPMVAFDNGSYSAPHTLAGQTVWVRA